MSLAHITSEAHIWTFSSAYKTCPCIHHVFYKDMLYKYSILYNIKLDDLLVIFWVVSLKMAA
jgi:hypothetical protein